MFTELWSFHFKLDKVSRLKNPPAKITEATINQSYIKRLSFEIDFASSYISPIILTKFKHFSHENCSTYLFNTFGLRHTRPKLKGRLELSGQKALDKSSNEPIS